MASLEKGTESSIRGEPVDALRHAYGSVCKKGVIDFKDRERITTKNDELW